MGTFRTRIISFHFSGISAAIEEKTMNSEKNGIRDPSVNRSIVSMKNCGISPKKHVRSFLGLAPIEVESQGVFRNFFSVKETRSLKALHYNFVKAAGLGDRILTRNMIDSFDVVLHDMIEKEYHAVVDHLGDIDEHTAIDEDLSFFEGPFVDTVCTGLRHVSAMDCNLYNKCCVFGCV